MGSAVEFRKVIDPWEEFLDVPGVAESRQAALKNYKKLRFAKKWLRFSRKRKSDIVVLGLKNYCKLSEEQKKKTHIIFKPRDLVDNPINIIRFLRNFTLDLGVYGSVYEELTCSTNNKSDFQLKTLEEISPKFAIIGSTIDPVQRLWAYAAQSLGIKTICMQHGIMSSKSPPEIKERNIIDYYFAYTPQQSKLIEKMIPIEKHQWTHDKAFFSVSFCRNKKINICLIGSDYERYGEAGLNNKRKLLDLYERLISAINKFHGNDFASFFYKKHPSENNGLKIVQGAKYISKVNESEIDIFFGVASTYLIDLASNDRCAIQLCDKTLPTDRYESYGFCKSIDVSYIEEFGLGFLTHRDIILPKLIERDISKIIDDLV